MNRVKCHWTDKEKETLLERLGDNISYDEIAKELGRGFHGVEQTVGRFYQKRKRIVGGYTQQDVADLMGVTYDSVAKWTDNGWLKFDFYAMKRKVYYISHDNLVEFLDNPDYWHYWDIEKIRDTALREWCQDLRPAYISTTQAGDMLCRCATYIVKQIKEGKLRGRRRGSKWMVHKGDVEERQARLLRFVPLGKKNPIEYRVCCPFTLEEDKEILERVERNEKVIEIARALKRNRNSIYSHIQLLQKRQITI